MSQDDIQLVWDDVVELMRVNTLAAEQLKNIALRRKISELEGMLAQVTADGVDDKVVPIWEPGTEKSS